MILSFFTVFITNSITAQFGVKPKKITEIFFRVNKKQNFNKGGKFKYAICARMKNGKIKEISSSSGLQIYSEGIKQIGNNNMLILKSNDCSKEYYSIDFTFTKGDYFFEGKDSIQLNYKGNISCDFSGTNGANGTKGKKENIIERSIRGRDGDDGRSGADGDDGGSAPYLKSYIRKDSLTDLILIDIFNLDDNQLYCYKTTSLSNGITFFVNGGKGGNGGKGSSGQNGRDERQKENGKVKRAGSGGNGGTGGASGTGGHGGTIEVYLDESLKGESSYISIQNSGGKAGVPGKGGSAGTAGKNMDGTITQNDGVSGMEGTNGNRGMSGEGQEIRIVNDVNFKLF